MRSEWVIDLGVIGKILAIGAEAEITWERLALAVLSSKRVGKLMLFSSFVLVRPYACN